jgi:hypothetical protein
MKRYVQTRAHARSLDYNWLGERPGRRWWDRFEPYTFFEHRTLIVEADGQGWRLYASAIPSVRRDAVRTQIFHAVMLEGGDSDESDSEEALRILGAALLRPDQLGSALDDQLDEDFVARCLSEPGSYADEVAGRLTRAFISLSSQRIDPEPMDKGEVAWGGAESADGPMGLARRAAALIADGSGGVAALLNLVSPSSVPGDLAPEGSAALLLERSTDSWSSLPKAEPIVSGNGKPGNRRLLIKLALILLGLAAAGVVGYFLYRRLQSPR